MTIGWLALLIAATPIDVGERAVAAIVVLQPGAGDLELPRRVVEAAQTAWHDETGLDAVLAADRDIDAAAIAGCPPKRLLSCALSKLGASPVDVMVIASVLDLGEGRAELAAWVIDVANARTLTAEDTDDESTLENRLFRRSILLPGVELDPRDAWALARFFRAMRPELLRALPLAQQLGSIDVELPWVPSEVRLDDRRLDAGDTRALALIEVRPGVRRIHVVDPQALPHVIELIVRPGRNVRASLATESTSEDVSTWRPARSALLIAGLALAVGGTTMAALSGTAGGGVRQGCLGRTGTAPRCDGLGTPTFAFDGSAAPTTDGGAINPGGIAPLPLGLALATTGAAWALGLTAIGEDGDAPWLTGAIGVALGALVYGVVAAAN